MSSCIVTPETMHVMLTGMADSNIPCWDINIGGIDPRKISAADIDELGRELYELNARAMAGRYDEPASDEGSDYRWQPAYERQLPDRVQWIRYYKAAECFVYQCSEDHVIGDPLLADVENFCTALARIIVADLPEYRAMMPDF
jgi:hypothetical protein